MNTLTIEFLADNVQAIPALVELFKTEWEPYYGPGGLGNAENDIRDSANRNRLPVALVAMNGKTICGTASLKKASITTYPDLSPWLSALVVFPEYRRKGIGGQLVSAIEKLAARKGYEEIFVGVGDTSGLSTNMLKKRDWVFVDRSQYFISDIAVYRKALYDSIA